jgi:hypothetical protein
MNPSLRHFNLQPNEPGLQIYWNPQNSSQAFRVGLRRVLKGTNYPDTGDRTSPLGRLDSRHP